MTTSVAAQSALRRALIAAAAVVLGATGLLLAAPAMASADAVFLITGTVTGTAVGATDAAALEGVTVRSFDADGVAGPTAVTDVAGLYTIAVPAAGDYSLEFNNCAASPACLPDYSSDWYGRNGLLSLAETFPLTEAAPIRVADFQLSAASTVSGQITDGSGQALGGAKVSLARPDAPNGLDATTAADGSYSFSQVPADTFDLTASYRDPDQSFQNVKYYADGAQQLTVAAGSTNGGADAALEYLPSIKGRVVDGSGNPLPHVAWSTFIQGGSSWSRTTTATPNQTDAAGWFSEQVEAGKNYRVLFTDDRGAAAQDIVRTTAFASQWYGAAGSTFANAENLVLGEGEQRSLGDVELGNAPDPIQILGPVDLATDAANGNPQRLVPSFFGFSPNDVTTRYQWLRDGVPIPDETGAWYDIQPAVDGGTDISVSITAEHSAGDAQVFPFPAVHIQGGQLAASTPVIGGTPVIGQVLTVDPGTWTPTPTLGYQWLRDGGDIPGATGDSYQLEAADVGTTITVRVLGRTPGYEPQSEVSGPAGPVLNRFSAAGAVSITGTREVGRLLTLNYDPPQGWSPTPTSFSIRWLRDGVAITGETSAQYTITTADARENLTVELTARLDGYQDRVVVTDAGAISGPFTSSPPPGPTLSGSGKTGDTLTVDPGLWVPTPSSFTYVWFRSSTDPQTKTQMPNTGPSYTIRSDDLGRDISVSVTPILDGYTALPQTTDSIHVIPGAVDPPSDGFLPTVTGDAVVNSQLVVHPGLGWSPAPVTFRYAWFSSAAPTTPIVGQTKSTLTVTRAMKGTTIRARVTPLKDSFTTAPLYSLPTAPVASPFTTVATPTITGATISGSTLTAHPGVWSPAASTLSYIWAVNNAHEAPSNRPTRQLTNADAGKTITVSVVASDSCCDVTTSPPSRPTAAITGLLVAPKPTVSSTGAPRVNEVFTAGNTDAWGPGQGTVTLSYQWYRSGTAISGARGATYLSTGSDYRKTLSVRVTGTKTDFASVSKTSNATSPLAAGTIVAPAATISGTPRVGSRLTALHAGWGPGTLGYRYQWYSNGRAVTGATSSTLTLSSSYRGKQVKVKISASKTGYSSISRAAADQVIGYGQFTNTGATITGAAVVGSKLTASRGSWSPTTSTTFGYQWMRDGVPIRNATGSTYTVTSPSQGHAVTVVITSTRSGFTRASATSNAIAVPATALSG